MNDLTVQGAGFVQNTPPLSQETVRQYLVRGNGSVTDQEVVFFIELCRSQGLNPFIGDAYLVKYGTTPATITMSKEAYLKRACRNPRYKGFEAGIIVQTKDGSLTERTGTVKLDEEKLVGGWAKVFVDGWEQPVYESVSFKEYDQGQASWKKIPATMIRKVAITHALREAFPEDFTGVNYSEENIAPVNVSAPVRQEIPVQPVRISDIQVQGLHKACMEHGIDTVQLCEMYGAADFTELTTEQLDHIRNNFNALKQQCAAVIKEPMEEGS